MKKTLIILLCLLTAGSLAWLIRPEYGSGYSEEQRRLWNERRALYPAAWVVETVSPLRDFSSPFYRDIAVITGKDSKTTDAIMEEKREREKELIAELEKNRDRTGPEYQVNSPVSVDVSRLPLEGMTEWEIAGQALAGDGDACLLMAQSILKRKGGSLELTWRGKHEVSKYLDCAAARKRPGVEFLKNFLNESWVFQKNNIRGGVRYVGEKPATEMIPGRSEFMKCLKKGDYLLYRTAACMMDANGFPEEYDRLIHAALMAGADQGRPECRRNLAALYFDRLEKDKKYFLREVSGEIRLLEYRCNQFFKWLPASWQKGMVKGLFFSGIMDVERSRSMKNYRMAAKYAQKSARQGDLTGMYWWLMSGITCSEYFSSREWNEIAEYSRVLLEAGYAPYIETMEKANRDGHYGYERAILNNAILKSIYSKNSYGEFWKKGYLKSRGGIDDLDDFMDLNHLEKAKEKVGRLPMLGLTDPLLENLIEDGYESGLLSRSSKEVQAYLLEQLEKWSQEGDFHAMYVLAEIYEKGISVPVDPGRAYALLKRALPEAVEYPRMHGRMKNEAGDVVFRSISLQHVIRLRMADLVLKYPDFPGRDEKEAFEAALKVLSLEPVRRDLNYPVEVFRILGQFHERGMGMPVDGERALEYYKQGAIENKACREGVDRLSPPDREGQSPGK